MNSLFGREEFDPPAKRLQDPRTALTMSGLWGLISIAWLGMAVDKVSRLHATGQHVSGLRVAAVLFWVFILLFWIWNGLKSFQKYRAQAG